MKKGVVIAVICIILVACIGTGAWYATSGNNDSDDEEIKVTDLRGREVTIPSDIDKIVCLSASSVRLVCYMGAYDKIVGVDDMDALNTGMPINYYMATYRIAYDIQEITCVGSEESYKDIIESGAQLIISSITDKGQLDSIQANTGIPVIGVTAEGNVDVDDDAFEENIRLLGKVLDLEKRADNLISGIDSILDELEKYKTDSNVEADCYIGGMFYMMQGGLLKTTGNYVPFEWTGANNVMSDSNNGNPYDVNLKDFIESNPQYIFIDNMTYSSSKSTFDSYKTEFQDMDAVKNSNIYSTLVYKYYGTNWESELMNAYYIGSILDPETYSFNIEEKCNEILSLFYPGSDIDYQKVMEKQSPGYSQLDW